MNTTLENHSNEGVTSVYAGFWIRVGAYVIDSIILSIPLWLLTSVIFFIFLGTSDVFYYMMYDPNYMYSDAEMLSVMGAYYTALIITMIVSFIVTVAYFAGLHSSKWQATIGKRLLKLKVIDGNGNRITFWRAFGRYVAMSFLSGILCIGYIMVAFTEKKQGLHDLIASTIVIKSE
ncbi:RDD family protein [Niallia sp. XMNu-256]|uniref:RDD family protein n=1 Tax=Niallia sp. XMNu-256 TaxID=3082444 RepID=UPI0030CB756B